MDNATKARQRFKQLKHWLGKEGVQKIADKHRITLDKAYLILRRRINNPTVYIDMMNEARKRKTAYEKIEKELVPARVPKTDRK